MEQLGPIARQQLAEREAALNRIASQHYSLMYRVAYRILRNPQDAEEALHNAWLNLCRAERLPQMDNEAAYLAQAVRREAILVFKKSFAAFTLRSRSSGCMEVRSKNMTIKR